jgi:hypothetical protein
VFVYYSFDMLLSSGCYLPKISDCSASATIQSRFCAKKWVQVSCAVRVV